MLDPATAISVKGVSPRPTVYVGPRLVVTKAVVVEARRLLAQRGPEPLGLWRSTPEPRPASGAACGSAAPREVVASEQAALAPDAWTLLQQTRAKFGLERSAGVGLDHVVFSKARDVESNPFDSSPSVRLPSVRPCPSVRHLPPLRPGRASSPGQHLRGARLRRAAADHVVVPRPRGPREDEIVGRRPVVAILDTGCAPHSWLDDVVDQDVTLDGHAIGYTDAATAAGAGRRRDRTAGRVDRPAGRTRHLHRRPGPPGLPRRRDPVLAGGPVGGAPRGVRLGRGARPDRRAGAPGPSRASPAVTTIDVLSLSMGYYHETPEDQLFDPTLLRDPRRPGPQRDAWWSAPPATTRPAGRRSRPRSPRGPTVTRSDRPSPTVPAGRLRRRAQPQPHRTPCSATRGPGSGPTPPARR